MVKKGIVPRLRRRVMRLASGQARGWREDLAMQAMLTSSKWFHVITQCARASSHPGGRWCKSGCALSSLAAAARAPACACTRPFALTHPLHATHTPTYALRSFSFSRSYHFSLCSFHRCSYTAASASHTLSGTISSRTPPTSCILRLTSLVFLLTLPPKIGLHVSSKKTRDRVA